MSEIPPDELQPPRGTLDYYGEKKLLRDFITSTLESTFKRYGFAPLQTPAFENYSVLSAKFAGGEEILRETYRFADTAGRELGLRYDLTVPLCRFVAANPALPKPFKRYAIGAVWRNGPLKAGRYREFVQADVDTIGVAGMQAEAELLALASDALTRIGVDFTIRVNNRKLLDGLLEEAGIAEEKRIPALLSIDKLEKIGEAGVRKELLEARGLSAGKVESVFAAFAEKNLARLAQSLSSARAVEGAKELAELFSLLEPMGCAGRVEFSPTMVRGLNYYTGTIFEAFLSPGMQNATGISSSLAAGGRYDELVGKFVESSAGRKEEIPAVGISFGADVLGAALERLPDSAAFNRLPKSVFVVPIRESAAASSIAARLRSEGIACGIDLLSRGIGKNLEYAGKLGYSHALIVGRQELDAGVVKVRDLKSGEEKALSIEQAVALLKS